MSTRRVPIGQAGKALADMADEIVESLGANLTFHSLRVAYEHAPQIGARDTGKANFSLNPSAGEPEPRFDEDRPAFPLPGAERLIPLRGRFGGGVHGYLTYHALDSDGDFDYAGTMLERGWSPQAPYGVLDPTRQYVESQAGPIAAEAVADTLREVGG